MEGESTQPSDRKEEPVLAAESLSKEELIDFWLKTLKLFYPDRHRRVYCLPPVTFKRVPYEWGKVAEQRVLVPVSFPSEHRITGEDTAQSLELSPLSTPPGTDGSEEENSPSMATDVDAPTAGRVWGGMSERADPSLLQVPESDQRSDAAQEQVLRALMEMFHDKISGKNDLDQADCPQTTANDDKEAAFIISELDFLDYLNEKNYAEAVSANEHLRFPRARDLKRFKNGKGGDFDVLVIHRHRGILAGEIKSVGSRPGGAEDDAVVKRVKEAAQQLEKSENLVRHLLKDMEIGDLPIRMTLILPSVKRCKLLDILESEKNKSVLQKLSKSLGLKLPSAKRAVELCLCEDEVEEMDLSSRKLKMRPWWDNRMSSENQSPLSESKYDNILARFCGPATQVYVRTITRPRLEVRTPGQAVSELGERLACLVLTYRQVELLCSPDPCVLLTGPPGTGKTVVLTLKGLKWLQEGHRVHVLSTRPANYSVSALMAHHLQQSFRPLQSESADVLSVETSSPSVEFHDFDFYEITDMESIVKKMEGLAERDGSLHILADEYGSSTSDKAERYQFFVKELKKRLPGLRFWAAVLRHERRPEELEMRKMTDPLRSAPTVQKEVQQGFIGLEDVYSYTGEGLRSPWDGPEVISLQHEGEGHEKRWPVDCRQCGREIGKHLRELGVGVETWSPSAMPRSSTDSSTTSDSASLAQQSDCSHAGNVSVTGLAANEITRCDTAGCSTSSSNSTSTTSTSSSDEATSQTETTAATARRTPARKGGLRQPEPLRFRDVFVLTNSFQLRDDVTSGHVNGVVAGLREAGMKVRVVPSMKSDPEGWKQAVKSTALADTDAVTVSHMGDVSGLERKVAVWLPGIREGTDNEAFAKKMPHMGRLYGVSRCSVQAILVDVPPDVDNAQVITTPDTVTCKAEVDDASNAVEAKVEETSNSTSARVDETPDAISAQVRQPPSRVEFPEACSAQVDATAGELVSQTDMLSFSNAQNSRLNVSRPRTRLSKTTQKRGVR